MLQNSEGILQPVTLISALMLLLVFNAPPLRAQSQKESSNSTRNSRTSQAKVHSQQKNSPPQHQKSRSSSSKKNTSKTRRPARPKGQLKPDAKRTREIQEKLIDSGAMAGSPNGVWDSRQMEGAIRKFQQMRGLNATGKLDVKTLKALGLKA
jgi:putative peptidoglycan binding protein